MSIKYLVYSVFFIFLAVGSAYSADENAENSLTLGFMPYLNAELLIEKYTPLTQYLGRKLGRDIHISVAKDYAEHIRLTGEDKIDISFLGGSPYVVIGDKYGKKPLLARYEFDDKPSFRSVLFVAKDSPLKTVNDLVGKNVAFGNPNSTLSTQVPLYVLLEAGVGLDDLKSYKHLRNHDNVVLGVEFGDFDAGAVAEEVYVSHADRNIKVLAYSPALSTHVLVARSTLSPALQKDISKALYGMKDDPEAKAALMAIGGNLTGFVSAVDSDYDLHRTILGKVLPILKH